MQGKSKPLFRYLEKPLRALVEKGYSGILLGPRQVGKTTMVKQIIESLSNSIEYPLQNPAVRLELEVSPERLVRQIEAVKSKPNVFIDEVQKVPTLLDAVQYLIDEDKAQFILTGSSARKLRRGGVNLLPGRLKHFYLDPLLWGELSLIEKNHLSELSLRNINKNVKYTFSESLIFGSLPAIVNLPRQDRTDFLRTYTQMYLEEEIRAEALSRKIGAFSRFLELAACESGTNPNFTKLSNESGISQPAIKEYYHILEDTLIVERVEPYLINARKRILSSARYYFFDIGVRNTLCRFTLDEGLVRAQKGILFEHAVILEIIRRIRVLNKNYKVNYWRTSSGAEVDCVIDVGRKVIPIEIKTSDRVVSSELKGIKIFLEDYKDIASYGYVISMEAKRKEKIAENIILLPWNNL